MPISTQKTTAVTTIARVTMVSDQRPSQSRRRIDAAVKSARPRPPVRQAARAASARTTMKGVSSSSHCSPSRTVAIGHCRARKVGRSAGISHSRTADWIQWSSGSVP